MTIELSVEAVDFLKKLFSQLTVNAAAPDSAKTCQIVSEIVTKLNKEA